MNRTIDVRTEMHKLASSKPVHAAAGVGALASESFRDLQVRFAKWRNGTSVSSLSNRASGYATTARARAATEYDKLAKRGQKALNGRGAGQGQDALSGKGSSQSQSPSQSHQSQSH
jgi:hypothetical protein